MPPRRKGPTSSTADLLRELAHGLKVQSTTPNVYGYKPHVKQELFHKSEAKKKLYIGGNRSGKTTGAVVEDIYWLRGNHPDRHLPEGPIRGRVVAVDLLQGVSKIIIPQFQQWLPPSLLKNGSWEDSYNKELRTLTLTNGSFVEFMSYEMDTEKFAGTSRHFIHYDEEPPRHIFNECNARLVDTNGSYWISMTPVEGMTWVYETIYQPGTTGVDKSIFIVEADMLDNPYISPEAAESYLSGLDEGERDAREHGRFVQLGGRVYKNFSRETHVIETIIPPREWEWYISLDHGFNNPTAVLWHAVSPENEVITFAEHYASEMVVDEHAKKIKATNAALGKEPDIWVADPAIAQRQGVTGTSIAGEYADRGCFFAPGNNDVLVGVARITQYLRLNPRTGRPRWRISEACPNLIRELEHLRWATYTSKKLQFENNKQEKIHKKDDHAADSARYFFTFMPDLTPPIITSPINENGGFNLQAATPNDPVAKFDKMLEKVGAPVEEGAELVDTNLAVIVASVGEPKTQWKIVEGSELGAMEYEG